MGKAIEKLAVKGGHEIILRIDAHNLEECTADNLARADVAIEFSRPESAFDNIRLCLESGTPVISGTTGWLERLPEAKTLCRVHGGAFLYASNFSIGVNLFFALNRFLARLMDRQPQYEVTMKEVHHTQKLDAPSGTAITLAEHIIEEMQRKSRWVSGVAGTGEAVPIESERTGSVPGTHQIRYASPIDTITIRHEAHSREGFARGALQAAEWITGKTGFFTMSDVLGL